MSAPVHSWGRSGHGALRRVALGPCPQPPRRNVRVLLGDVVQVGIVVAAVHALGDHGGDQRERRPLGAANDRVGLVLGHDEPVLHELHDSLVDQAQHVHLHDVDLGAQLVGQALDRVVQVLTVHPRASLGAVLLLGEVGLAAADVLDDLVLRNARDDHGVPLVWWVYAI